MGWLRGCEEMLKVRTKTNMSSKDFFFFEPFFFKPLQRISFASMYSHRMVFGFAPYLAHSQ